MRKLLLLFPLLFGCTYFNADPWKTLGAERYLFVRNGLDDTLNIQVVSPDDSKHRIYLTVAPKDSACAKYPFVNVRSVLIASTKKELRYFDGVVSAPGLDWLLVSENQTVPHPDVCLR